MLAENLFHSAKRFIHPTQRFFHCIQTFFGRSKPLIVTAKGLGTADKPLFFCLIPRGGPRYTVL